MKIADVNDYFKSLFESKLMVTISAIGISIYNFLFPTKEYKLATLAVLGVMVLDILTKIYAISHIEGGIINAFRRRKINSSSFSKGTMDKLVIFGVMVCICGFAYRLTIVAEVAIWFTQIVFTLMFLRDAFSIFENLSDAGIDVGIFKHIIKKRLGNYVDKEQVDKLCNKKESEVGAKCDSDDDDWDDL